MNGTRAFAADGGYGRRQHVDVIGIEPLICDRAGEVGGGFAAVWWCCAEARAASRAPHTAVRGLAGPRRARSSTPGARKVKFTLQCSIPDGGHSCWRPRLRPRVSEHWRGLRVATGASCRGYVNAIMSECVSLIMFGKPDAGAKCNLQIWLCSRSSCLACICASCQRPCHIALSESRACIYVFIASDSGSSRAPEHLNLTQRSFHWPEQPNKDYETLVLVLTGVLLPLLGSAVTFAAARSLYGVVGKNTFADGSKKLKLDEIMQVCQNRWHSTCPLA